LALSIFATDQSYYDDDKSQENKIQRWRDAKSAHLSIVSDDPPVAQVDRGKAYGRNYCAEHDKGQSDWPSWRRIISSHKSHCS
jgi:hypothetical protein